MSASELQPVPGSVEAKLAAALEGAGANVVAAYLFGSVARGEARTGSDIDVAVLYRADPPRTLEGIPATLETELTRAIGARIDLVVLNRAPIDLAHRVLRDGKLLLERDRTQRIAFEVRTRNRYWDLLPLLRRYRAAAGDRP